MLLNDVRNSLDKKNNICPSSIDLFNYKFMSSNDEENKEFIYKYIRKHIEKCDWCKERYEHINDESYSNYKSILNKTFEKKCFQKPKNFEINPGEIWLITPPNGNEIIDCVSKFVVIKINGDNTFKVAPISFDFFVAISGKSILVPATSLKNPFEKHFIIMLDNTFDVSGENFIEKKGMLSESENEYITGSEKVKQVKIGLDNNLTYVNHVLDHDEKQIQEIFRKYDEENLVIIPYIIYKEKFADEIEYYFLQRQYLNFSYLPVVVKNECEEPATFNILNKANDSVTELVRRIGDEVNHYLKTFQYILNHSVVLAHAAGGNLLPMSLFEELPGFWDENESYALKAISKGKTFECGRCYYINTNRNGYNELYAYIFIFGDNKIEIDSNHGKLNIKFNVYGNNNKLVSSNYLNSEDENNCFIISEDRKKMIINLCNYVQPNQFLQTNNEQSLDKPFFCIID